jgi:hypothetical protein
MLCSKFTFELDFFLSFLKIRKILICYLNFKSYLSNIELLLISLWSIDDLWNWDWFISLIRNRFFIAHCSEKPSAIFVRREKNTFEYSMKMVQEEKNGSLLFFFCLSLKNRFLLGGQRSVKYFLHFFHIFDLRIN